MGQDDTAQDDPTRDHAAPDHPAPGHAVEGDPPPDPVELDETESETPPDDAAEDDGEDGGPRVLFVDTSVLCNLVDVPGRNQQRDEVMAEFRRLVEEGTRFVIPVTAVVETGNHISHAGGNRRAAAKTLVRFLEQAATSEAPWQLHAVTWDARFLAALRAGGGTGQSLVDLLGSAQMGTGDVAILCERDEFRARTNYDDVGVWTLERILAAYS